MTLNDPKRQCIKFDDYIRQGELFQLERAESWRVAIGFNYPCQKYLLTLRGLAMYRN